MEGWFLGSDAGWFPTIPGIWGLKIGYNTVHQWVRSWIRYDRLKHCGWCPSGLFRVDIPPYTTPRYATLRRSAHTWILSPNSFPLLIPAAPSVTSSPFAPGHHTRPSSMHQAPPPAARHRIRFSGARPGRPRRGATRPPHAEQRGARCKRGLKISPFGRH